MSDRLNRCKHGFACILALFIITVSQMVPVSAATPPQLQSSPGPGCENPETILLAVNDVALNSYQYQPKESEQNADTKNVGENNSYNELGFSKIDVTALSQYINVEKITEKQFYDLNFNMKIASVTLTTDNDLLLRTIDNMYCTIKISDEYIKALELTGVVEKGISSKLSSKKKAAPTTFSTFILVSLIVSFVLFIGWFYSTSRRTYQPDKLIVGTKEKPKNGMVSPEKKITFNEVQGIDELKPDLFRLVDSLKHPAKYKRLGARPTKGLILYGPPGTGKTLIAKAISGEAEVPFFSASGSDFVEKYVGVGASRIRDLFTKARKSSPCIVFIDELDAIGGNRGESNNSERDQTINALLTELDGFTATEGILTICATNRLDILDAALTRPGRFDLKIAVNLPDKQARYQILKLHSTGKTLSDEVKIEALAKKTNGFSGAELENLLNEAALIAATKDKEWITNEDIEDAFFKIIMNGHKKERVKDDEYARLIAYHESGHTLSTKLLTNDGVPTVTIIQSTSGAGGVTFRAPEDVPLKSKKYLRNLVKVMYAGRAAEEVLLDSKDDITTGASEDIKQATEIIKQYIAIYGMGNQGMIDMTQLTNHFDMIEEASGIATELYKETVEFLIKNRSKLDRLALALLDKETLGEAEIDLLISDNQTNSA
ncbi:MAG TPA: AAA family ATPase [Anaerovoracaceae bacterium]|nr:AAA family ATPase [Anaerovoracaceae bacterium]